MLATHLRHFLSCKESLPIPIAQNIQHIQLFTGNLDVIQGSIKCDLVYSTLYCLTLRGWLDSQQQIQRIVRHFMGAWDELYIEAGLLHRRSLVCIPPELLNCTFAELHGAHQGIDKMQAQARGSVLAQHQCRYS